MDSTMTIMVRVVGRQAIAQLNGIAAGVNGVAAAGSGSAAKQTAHFFSGINGSMVNMGKNLQWVGRQLTFNFTLPLVAAGAALFKANNSIERSMTQVIKVYGDASFSAERVTGETDALRTSFELLSTRFGVHQEEVIDIAAAWASAGSAGVGLANNTRATMEAMILGELSAIQATEGLIAIQAVWQLSTMAVAGETSELTEALALLNIVENQTGIRFAGLIEVFSRAGGVARTAGMSIRDLAAFAATLVPATGSATQAGNSLKTIISRLQSPTEETKEHLALMGIEVDSLAWGSLTATEKILSLADSFNALDTAAQNQVSSIIATRWQVNRFSVMMRDVVDETGYFNKAMKATADQQVANEKYQQELNTVLESSPRKWQIMTNAIRNSMAKAFIPLMPVIMTIVSYIAQLATAFQNLAPSTQKMVILGLAVMALIGPVMQLGGAFMQLGGLIARVVKVLAVVILGPLSAILKVLVLGVTKALLAIASAAAAAVSAPLWAVVAVVAAIVFAIMVILNDDLRGAVWDTIKDIGRAFGQLPRIMVNVFNAVIRIIGRAIEIIREALSYLNPFARHSPSLVDNVRAGVATILSEYMKFQQIPNIIRSAIAALNAFGMASAPGARGQQEAELQGYQQTISTQDPAAGAAASAMIPEIMGLQDQLDPLAQEIAAQSLVVAAWAAQLSAANAVLEDAQEHLDAVTIEYQAVGDAIEAAQGRIQDLANTKITGMRAMKDQIFAIAMQQNQLNLELVNFARQGYTIDAIRDKYAALNGEIEMLRGEQAALRNAGAGSDVLSVYDDQIAAIEAQRQEMGGIEQQIIDIQAQLEALDLEKQWAELTQSITFDPLLKQIDEMVNGVAEMSFDDVIAGIQEQQTLIAQLQPQYDALGDAVAVEEANVLAVTAARDALQVSLDEEQRKLDGLNEAYTGIKNLIQEMTSAMSEYANAAQTAADAAAGAGGAGEGGGLTEGDYGIQGGGSTLGPEGLEADIAEFNKLMEEEVQRMLEGMGMSNLFDPVKQAWSDFVAWLKGIWDGIRSWWDGLWESIVTNPTLVGIAESVAGFFTGIIAWFTDTFIPKFMAIWDGIADFFVRVWDAVSGVFMDVWGWISDNVVPVVESFIGLVAALWERFGPFILGLLKGLAAGVVAIFYGIKTAINLALIVLSTLVKIIMNGIRIAWGIAWNLIGGVVTIIWDFIVSVVEGALLIIKGIFDFFAGLLTGDWDRMWGGIVSILQGVWEIIWAVISTPVELIVQLIETSFKLVVGIIEFAIETLIMIFEGGFKFIMALVEGVVAIIVSIVSGFVSIAVGLFETLWGFLTVGWEIFWGFLEGLWNIIWTVATSIWEGIKAVITDPIGTAKTLLSGLWDEIEVAAEIAWNILKGIAFTIWDGIKATIMLPINTVKGLLDTAWEGIKTAAKTAWDWVEDKIGGPIGRIKDFIQGLIDMITGAIDKFNDLKDMAMGGVGGVVDDRAATGGMINKNANGGIIKRTQLSWLAEGNRPEVVIPLTNTARALELLRMSGLDGLLMADAFSAAGSANNMYASNAHSGRSSAAEGRSSSSGSTTIIQINGNLEFPNIKSGDDAKKFVENLKVLAG